MFSKFYRNHYISFCLFKLCAEMVKMLVQPNRTERRIPICEKTTIPGEELMSLQDNPYSVVIVFLGSRYH